MSNDTPQLARGDEYVVLYSGGPNDGRTDRRISTDGTWDSSITVVVGVDGKEAMIDYDSGEWRQLGGEYHVTYTYDPTDSEHVEDPEDRGGRQ